jgi:alkanesulfonate monooxygenase SsuD/methylene tetrahydromethanopterin reductase-like flavin-dependent oxidoreductase (luciferase family)
VLLAALRPRMLHLAGSEADGAVLNWLASYDVPRCVEAIGNPDADVVARVFICPTGDAAYARNVGRWLIASYLTVPAYAAFHRWLGRGETLREMNEKWAAGDRAGAAAAVPDEVVDALVLHGTPESCRAQAQAYADAGVRTPVLAVLPVPELAEPAAMLDVLRRLGPAA